MPVTEVVDPEVAQQSRLSSEQFADRLAQRELERIRKETPRYPRWFVPTAKFIDLSPNRLSRIVRHDDETTMFYFTTAVGWVRWRGPPQWDLEYTLRMIRVGFAAEVSRGDAFLITGGNP